MPTKEILNRMNPGKFDATRAAQFDIDRAKGSLVSYFGVERALNIDRNARTVEMAFATDQPIEHWFGMLELDVSAKAVVLDRVNNGVAPLLVNHDRDQHAGVIVSNSVSLGSTIRGTTKFSRSQLGEDMLNDVEDEIRTGTSVGFLVHDMVLVSNKKDEVPIYRATKWEILEVSLASIPADIDCGVGRSLEVEDHGNSHSQIERGNSTQEKIMTPEEIAAAAAAEAQRTAAPAAPVVDTRSNEDDVLQRSRSIVAFGEIFGQGDLARTMIAASPDVTLDDVRLAIRAQQTPNVQIPVVPAVEAAARQGGEVQLARSSYRGGELKAFKGEKAHERAHKVGMHLAAVLLRNENAIAWCRERGIALTRAQTGGDNTAGGFTVIPEFDQTLFQLIIQYGVLRPNADVEPMQSDTKFTTRRKGGLTAYPVGASQRGTYSSTTDDQFELVARKWMVLAKYEDELNEDSFINWADRLVNEAGIALAYAEDNSGFNGDGTSTYHGIVGLITKLTAATAGVVTAAGATYASVTLANMTSVIGKLPQFARKSGNVKWYCSSSVWANVLERIALAANGSAYADIKGELTPVFAGKPVEIVEVMPSTEATGQLCVIYGNLSQAVTFGDRRGITVKMTDSNDVDFESDLHAVKVTERFDVNAHDVGDTSVAGPVVGLKLA